MWKVSSRFNRKTCRSHSLGKLELQPLQSGWNLFRTKIGNMVVTPATRLIKLKLKSRRIDGLSCGKQIRQTVWRNIADENQGRVQGIQAADAADQMRMLLLRNRVQACGYLGIRPEREKHP
jgi:hypothetical protein